MINSSLSEAEKVDKIGVWKATDDVYVRLVSEILEPAKTYEFNFNAKLNSSYGVTLKLNDLNENLIFNKTSGYSNFIFTVPSDVDGAKLSIIIYNAAKDWSVIDGVDSTLYEV